MRYSSVQLTFQEVPNEISLCFLISGCPLRCAGCHSTDSWASSKAAELNKAHFLELLSKHKDAISCVCFLGGEWHQDHLIELCKCAQNAGLKTCLYTGLEDVNNKLKAVLNFLKVGRYIKERGGLSMPNTNQKFIDLATNETLNYYFNTQGGYHGTTGRTAEEQQN